MEISQKTISLHREMYLSPIFFVSKAWGIVPERDNAKFEKGKHMTFQQHDLLLAVERAVQGKGLMRISVESGHGTGKTCALAWLILWFLWTRKDSQIPCTAPTSDQLHDVLWKEVKLWLSRMPKAMADKFEWSNGYIRFVESPETWFARAKTARREAPEALAGVHGEHVMFVIDEASGVPDEVFMVGEGALTGQNVLVIMISNHTRLFGYFHDSHNKDKANWQRLSFNAEESPIVDVKFVERIIGKYGLDSDEYRVRVKGQSPKEDGVDDKGYVPLLMEGDIRHGEDLPLVGRLKMGVDPSGEGSNETVWVIRDGFRSKVLAKEKTSTTMGIAQRTATLSAMFPSLRGRDIIIDNFGEGANVAYELSKIGIYTTPVNVGDEAEDAARFLNKRAEVYWRLREWLKKGGEVVGSLFDSQLLNIRFRAELSRRIKIMGKDEMRRNGIESPDIADALSLTFYEEDFALSQHPNNQPFNPYDYF